MVNRDIQLYAHEDCYQVEGNSHVVVWRSGDIVVETPEMLGLRAGLERTATKGFSLDEKTHELSIDFLQSGEPNRIDLGIVSDYDEATSWVTSVNELYSR